MERVEGGGGKGRLTFEEFSEVVEGVGIGSVDGGVEGDCSVARVSSEIIEVSVG